MSILKSSLLNILETTKHCLFKNCDLEYSSENMVLIMLFPFSRAMCLSPPQSVLSPELIDITETQNV